MLNSNPDKPSLKSLSNWKYYRMCQDCSQGDMNRPNKKSAHPPTNLRRRPDVKNGTHISIDASGAFQDVALADESQAFVFCDLRSGYKWACPTQDKRCETLVEQIKLWISHVGVKPDTISIKAIRTDNEFMCSPLREFCVDKGIKLTSCAPHTHQQNSIAETTVKSLKRTVRINENMGGMGKELRAMCWTYAGQQLS